MVFIPQHCVHGAFRHSLEYGDLIQKVEYCCYCGEERTRRLEPITEGHGPYLRAPVERDVTWKDGCPKAPSAEAQFVPASNIASSSPEPMVTGAS